MGGVEAQRAERRELGPEQTLEAGRVGAGEREVEGAQPGAGGKQRGDPVGEDGGLDLVERAVVGKRGGQVELLQLLGQADVAGQLVPIRERRIDFHGERLARSPVAVEVAQGLGDTDSVENRSNL